MKILMTLMGLDIGGAETHVVELAKELKKQGHDVIIASNGGVYVPYLKEAGVRHAEIPMNQRDPKKMMKSLHLLRVLIREEKPDLVHAHARIPAFLCGILHRQMHFPFITSAHWVFEVTPLLRVMTNWGERTVAVSEDIKTYLMENYRIPADQIHVTINGIDTEQFAPGTGDPALRENLGLSGGPVICLVSRLDESRALAAWRLLDVLPEISETVPGVQLLLVGGGDQEAALRQKAEETNAFLGRNAVVMTGPRTDVAALVALGDVFVGVSRAALEAMAAAKPVILAGNEGYVGVFAPDSLSGAQESNFCCRGYDMVTDDALRADLLRLLQMPEAQKQELGAFGREVVLEQYSAHRMCEDYLAAYEVLLHPKKPVKAVISGYYGYDNLGDDAILRAIDRQMSHLEAPVRMVVLSKNPDKTARKFGLRAVPRFSAFGVFHAIRTSDVLISGGGSLLQDSTSTRSLLYYLAVIRLALVCHKPVFLYANGIGPLEHKGSRTRVTRTLKQCDAVTLRDEDSMTQLRALGVTRDDILVTGDPAFILEGTSRRQSMQRLMELGISEDASIIGVSVRRASGMDRAVPEFAALCDRLSREKHKTIVFIVMQEPGDSEMSQEIRNRMTEPSYLLATPNRPEEMLGAIGCMDALISMRLHTIIFAAKERVPVVGCVYDPKVAAFLKMLGMPSCGSPEDIRADSAFAVTEELLGALEENRRRLDGPVRDMEQRAHQTAALFSGVLKKRGIGQGD